MRKIKTIFSLLLAIGLQHFAYSQAVYDTLQRKQSFMFDAAAGGIMLIKNQEDGESLKSELNNFKSNISFQVQAGYAVKLNLVQLEWKAGYTQVSYDIDVKNYGSPKGMPRTTTNVGTSTQHAGYVQLLGVTFGRERSWGSLQTGPYIRYNFWTDATNSGKQIVESWHVVDNSGIRIIEESELNPPIYFGKYTLGFQIGANFKLQNQDEVHFGLILNASRNKVGGHTAIHCLVSTGYYFNIKKDRVVLRR